MADDEPADTEEGREREDLRTTEIFPAIDREREFQDKKYPGPCDLSRFLLVMELELAEAKRAVVKESPANALREILQAVATGVSAMEQHGVHERKFKKK